MIESNISAVLIQRYMITKHAMYSLCVTTGTLILIGLHKKTYLRETKAITPQKIERFVQTKKF